jgi:HlyD family secretion protein
MRTTIVILLLVAICGGAFYYTNYLRAETPPNFRIAEVKRGELMVTISATGTLEPEEVVDVGAQVLGRIKEFGPDSRAATDPKYAGKHVDYNSVVKEGDLLAQIDPSLYQATYDQAMASLARAEADLLQAEAKAVQTKAEWDRAQRLRSVKMQTGSSLQRLGSQMPAPTVIKGISDADFILAKANYEVAQANVKVSKAAVDQAKATVFSAKTNLNYTTIKSPVDGTVIARRVNIGQTVVASLNAPSLFLIAQDLRRMEIWTAVNEADIGQLKVGQPVHFTVDTFAGEVFHGEVEEIRLDAEMQNHVVVYRVIVSTPNNDLRLLPYLSARVEFEIKRRPDALLVPNAALRYTPRPELVMAAPAPTAEKSEVAAETSSETEVLTADSSDANDDGESKDAGDSTPDEEDGSTSARRVWVRQGNKVYPVDVLIGLTDGLQSEVVGGELKPGMELVLGEELAEVSTETNNPLAPPRFRGKSKSKS